MSVARVAAALLVVAACGKSKPAASKDVAARDAAAVVMAVDGGGAAEATGVRDAAPTTAPKVAVAPFWADRPEPALRALGAALEQLPTREADEWLKRRALPGPEGEPPEEPPAAVQAAIDALVAWDGSGALAPMPCSDGLGNPLPFRLLVVSKAALELADGPADVRAHAALRMGLALRGHDNDAMPMMVGAAITKEAGEVFTRKGVTAPLPASLAVAEDLPWRALESSARCITWTLDTLDLSSADAAEMMAGFRQMGRDPDQAFAEETQAVKAFWAETLAQAAKARTRAELRAVVQRRIDEAQASRPRSLMVPLLGAPFAVKSLLRDDE